MTEQDKQEKVIQGLQKFKTDLKPFAGNKADWQKVDDALELLKAQNEVIEELLKVGYPHNFQREEPWIVNYMYAITNVIKKAVNLNNESAI